MHDDAIDAILEGPAPTASEAEANAVRLRACDDRVAENLPLVMYLAGRFAGRGVEAGDLVGVGSLGLMRAAELYDPARGEFSVYAGIWVKALMRRAIDRARDDASEAAGDAAEDVPDPGAVGPSQALEGAEAAAAVRSAVERLPAKLRRAIVLRFGLDGGGSRTLVEVAALVGGSKQVVHQAAARALERLRAALG